MAKKENIENSKKGKSAAVKPAATKSASTKVAAAAPTKNLLQQVLEQKSAAQALGGKSGNLGKDLSKRFGSPNSFSPQKPTKRGGRNAQGKP